MERAACSVFHDAANGRLVYVGREADEGYWDAHWLDGLKPEDVRKPDRFVVGVTKRFLPKGAKVVDAGCGVARTVFGLQQAGYDAYGVDYASETVARINRLAPELKVSVADVRSMNAFEDGFFDGVWSLGVIEHFYEGYEEILRETRRLLRVGGYAFVTVPSMSPLRRLKAAAGGYQPWIGSDTSGFYQFVLQPDAIIGSFERAGFDFVQSATRGGFKGLKDEVTPLRPMLQALYDSGSVPLRALRAGLDRMLGPFSYHTRLYVFRKTGGEAPE